jgi:hypothetical protein
MATYVYPQGAIPVEGDLPSMAGRAGQFLSNNGLEPIWQTIAGSSGGAYPAFATFAALPTGQPTGTIAVVLAPTGIPFVNKRNPGLYEYNGTVWNYLGPIPEDYFSDSVLTIRDDADPTKLAQFELSGITTGTSVTLTVPNQSGTISLEGHSHAIASITGLQAALDAKLDDSQATAFGLALIDDIDAAGARTTLGLGTAATQPSTAFAAAVHGHTIAETTGLQAALDAKLDDSQATAFGLSLLDDVNAADARTTLGLGTAATQPSTAFATAVHGHTIADTTGLQAALDAKAPSASPALTGTPTAPTAGVATDNTQLATTQFAHDVVQSVGLDGPITSLGAVDLNTITLGRIVSVNGLASVGATLNWPQIPGQVGTTPEWWNVQTYGGVSRVTQIATYAFSGDRGRTWVRGNHDGVWSAWTELVDSSRFNERVDDRVAALIVGGAGITAVYADPPGTLTISATGGGGGLTHPQVLARVSLRI